MAHWAISPHILHTIRHPPGILPREISADIYFLGNFTMSKNCAKNKEPISSECSVTELYPFPSPPKENILNCFRAEVINFR